MYYSAISILALFILVIENHDVFLHRKGVFARPVWSVYRKFLVAVTVYYITDILWGILEYLKLPRLLFIDTSVYFVAMAVGVFFWTQYLVTYLNEKRLFERILLYSGRALAILIALLVVINIFVPVLFTVDEAGTYKALTGRYLAIIGQLVMLLLVSGYAVSVLVRRRSEKKQRYRMLVFFGLIMAFFLCVQLWFPYLPLYAIGYMLGTCLLHALVIGEENEEYRRDLKETKRIVELMKENEQAKAAYREAVSAGAVYENIVLMLSKDYFDLYYIDLETNDYIEYGSKTEEGYRTEESRGNDFFEAAQKDVNRLVYEEDRQLLLEALDKEKMLAELEANGVLRLYYRLMIEGKPTYVSMKAMRVSGDDMHVILGVTNVDAQMKDRMAAEQAAEERKAYVRLSAFSHNLLVLYVVDLATEEFTEFSSTADYEEFGIAKKGADFFGTTYKNSRKAVYEEDQNLFQYMFTPENIAEAIAKDGIFVMDYRLVINGKPTYIRLKAAEVEEDGRRQLIVGIENVDKYIRREQKQAYDLSVAKEMAFKDALTGVKNKLAFVDAEEELSKQIQAEEEVSFAILVCDINDLKEVNDTQGHQAGDLYIQKGCSVICNVFRHSPVFRIGGDEFAVICRGQDYEHIDTLLEEMDSLNTQNHARGEVKVAYGMARFEPGESVQSVFERADKRMYENKAALKA
ncbi:MAG: diguanylate cyclase [Ruminococcaceae bacterium]|nr:diguanylate cyclase [Oscillospiraceae bacterium]